MEKALIKLSFRHVIDVNARTPFEQEVFHESYNELLMQVQAYNREQQFTTWEQVRAANPKSVQLRSHCWAQRVNICYLQQEIS